MNVVSAGKARPVHDPPIDGNAVQEAFDEVLERGAFGVHVQRRTIEVRDAFTRVLALRECHDELFTGHVERHAASRFEGHQLRAACGDDEVVDRHLAGLMMQFQLEAILGTACIIGPCSIAFEGMPNAFALTCSVPAASTPAHR